MNLCSVTQRYDRDYLIKKSSCFCTETRKFARLNLPQKINFIKKSLAIIIIMFTWDNMLILISPLNIWSYRMIKLVLFKIKGLANGDLEPLIYFMDTSIFIFKQTATNYFIQIWKFYLNEKYFSFVLLSFYLVILNYEIIKYTWRMSEKKFPVKIVYM